MTQVNQRNCITRTVLETHLVNPTTGERKIIIGGFSIIAQTRKGFQIESTENVTYTMPLEKFIEIADKVENNKEDK